jgi:hypothetical protein
MCPARLRSRRRDPLAVSHPGCTPRRWSRDSGTSTITASCRWKTQPHSLHLLDCKAGGCPDRRVRPLVRSTYRSSRQQAGIRDGIGLRPSSVPMNAARRVSSRARAGSAVNAARRAHLSLIEGNIVITDCGVDRILPTTSDSARPLVFRIWRSWTVTGARHR